MLRNSLRWVLFCISVSCAASAQVIGLTNPTDKFGNTQPMDAMQTAQMDFNFFLIGSRDPHSSKTQSPSGSISKLDLAAPGKARREYQEGYRLLMRKDFQPAIAHLQKAIAIYSKFVAAHNALGSAYLTLGQNEDAQSEFSQSVALDDHLPNSYLNLGCAELALKHLPAAEEALRKASSIAPLDDQLQLALAYAELANQDYPGVLATALLVHQRKHDDAPVVHFFAASAYAAQGKLTEAQHEMETLLQEDPKSTYNAQFRQILEGIKAEQVRQANARLHPAQKLTFVSTPRTHPTAEEIERQRQTVLLEQKEREQIAEVEAAPDPGCVDCVAALDASRLDPLPNSTAEPADNAPHADFRMTANEVSILFAVTDHGKAVRDLSSSDLQVRDNSQLPGAIVGFRNESQLPLRLGLVIDTSDSIGSRFSFEQSAAAEFLKQTVTGKDDLAFVVGVNNSVLMVQDFTADPALTVRAVNQLAPGGGTALWDAVSFTANKLAAHQETQPVARVLVVVSDGEDNSSSLSLREAISAAQRSDVAVYTVSTREGMKEASDELVGDHALRALSELTGGIALMPGSVRTLKNSLTELQEVIHGRYLVAYKPASFQSDGRYHAVNIEAQKDGHKLRVFARKGYYASDSRTGAEDH